MSTGVLLYCFNTPEVAYHKFAEKCIKLIRKNLKLSKYEITIVLRHLARFFYSEPNESRLGKMSSLTPENEVECWDRSLTQEIVEI